MFYIRDFTVIPVRVTSNLKQAHSYVLLILQELSQTNLLASGKQWNYFQTNSTCKGFNNTEITSFYHHRPTICSGRIFSLVILHHKHIWWTFRFALNKTVILTNFPQHVQKFVGIWCSGINSQENRFSFVYEWRAKNQEWTVPLFSNSST